MLVNVWDPLSARIVEDLGYPAIATSSASVAWAHGYADGEKIPLDEVLAATKAIVEAGEQEGVPLVINARTDAFLAGLGSDDAWRLQQSIDRGNAYLDAGADCIFVPGVDDEALIEKLVAGIRGKV